MLIFDFSVTFSQWLNKVSEMEGQEEVWSDETPAALSTPALLISSPLNRASALDGFVLTHQAFKGQTGISLNCSGKDQILTKKL